jgi:putative membrane protein
MNYLKDYILTFLKGMSMGAADVVPGVSGGSIALIAGIYQKLLDSIKSIDKTALGFLFKFEIKSLWEHINGGFLFTLLAGILTSIFSLSKVITYLMDNHPIPLWSFFLRIDHHFCGNYPKRHQEMEFWGGSFPPYRNSRCLLDYRLTAHYHS